MIAAIDKGGAMAVASPEVAWAAAAVDMIRVEDPSLIPC
jgi:hypothetical protein